MVVLRSVAVLAALSLIGSVRSLDVAAVKVEQLAKSSTSWEQTPLPDYPRGRPEITVLRVTIPPHSELAFHKHPVINAGVLTRGSLIVETDSGKKLPMKAGEALIEVVDQWHRGLNEGDEPVELIVFYVGVAGEPITIKR